MCPGLEENLRCLTSPILIVSAGLSGLQSRALCFQFSLHQITESSGLRAALSDSRSATVDTSCHPRALELPGLGSDGGDAPTARGLLGATKCAWKLGQAQGSQLTGVWEACHQWAWVGQTVSPEQYIKSDSTTEDTALFRES